MNECKEFVTQAELNEFKSFIASKYVTKPEVPDIVKPIVEATVAGAMVGLTTNVNNLKTEVNTLKPKVSDAAGQAASALALFASLAASVGALIVSIATIKVLGDRIDQLEKWLGDLGNEITKLIGKYGELQAEINNLKNVDALLDSKITYVYTIATKALATANIALSYGQVANEKADQALSEIEIIHDDINSLELSVANLYNWKELTEKYIVKLLEDVETLNNIIQDYFNWREFVENYIKQISNDIEDLKAMTSLFNLIANQLKNQVNGLISDINQTDGKVTNLDTYIKSEIPSIKNITNQTKNLVEEYKKQIPNLQLQTETLETINEKQQKTITDIQTEIKKLETKGGGSGVSIDTLNDIQNKLKELGDSLKFFNDSSIDIRTKINQLTNITTNTLIQTSPEAIITATKTGICETTKPAGCLSKNVTDPLLEALEDLDLVSVDIELVTCVEHTPQITTQTIQVLSGMESQILAITTQLNNLAISQCECCDNAIAAVPEWWQVRLEANRPQWIVQFAEDLGDGKYGAPKYPITIPHPKITTLPIDFTGLPIYQKGSIEGILTLSDNSKVIVNCIDANEVTNLLNAIQGLIINDYLINSHIKIGERKGLPLSEITVTPRIIKYFPTGLQNTKPEWIYHING